MVTNLPIVADSLTLYLSEIRKFKLLTKDEERNYAIKFFEESSSHPYNLGSAYFVRHMVDTSLHSEFHCIRLEFSQDRYYAGPKKAVLRIA